MLLKIQRRPSQGESQLGILRVDGRFFCHTLENNSCKIVPGFYPVRLTKSPLWGEVLPLIDRVIGRSGIRIHPGNTAADSQGCVLVGEADGQRLLSSRRTFTSLLETLRQAVRNREEIWIEVKEWEAEPLDANVVETAGS